MQAAVTASDLQGRIIHWNRHAEVLFGWTPAQALGRDFRDLLVTPASQDAVDAIRSNVLEGGSWEGELPIAPRDGPVLLSYSTIAPIRNVDHSVSGIVTVSVDITERSRQERLLAARTGVTRVLAEASDLAAAAPQVVLAVCENLGWEVGALWRVDEAAGVLRCIEVSHQAATGAPTFEDQPHQEDPLRSGVGLPGRVWTTGEPAWIADVTEDDNFPRAAAASQEALHGAFGFPIRQGDGTEASGGLPSSRPTGHPRR